MIPKVIHYCWFGGTPLPPLAKKCIDSWKRYCPNYEIVEWNEGNYDIEGSCEFVRKAYECRKWAFVSDYARLDIVWRYGGVYLDIDVELIKPLDSIVDCGMGFFGCEQEGSVNSGVGFACEKGHPILKEMMDYYQCLSFSLEHMGECACPIINTYILTRHGFRKNNSIQMIDGIQILPTEYLCPENMWTGERKFTDKTISIHHFNASWQSPSSRFRIKGIVLAKKILPSKIVECVRMNIRRLRSIYGK